MHPRCAYIHHVYFYSVYLCLLNSLSSTRQEHCVRGWSCCTCLHVAVEAFVDTDQKYLQADSGGNRDDGCTAVTAILVGQNLIVANVGDSRAVLSKGGQGKPKEQFRQLELL